MKLKISKSLLMIFALYGCSSASQIEINTLPDKSVVTVIGEKGEIKTLGETPLNMSPQQIFQGSDLVTLSFSKEGYHEQKVFFPKPVSNSTSTVSINLKKEIKPIERNDFDERIQKVTEKIVKAQRYLQSKSLKESQRLLEGVVDEYPELGVAHDLLGNVYFLINNKSQALFHYRKAKELSSFNSQREKVILDLERGN